MALATTSATLAALPVLAPRHGRLPEFAVLVSANAVATLVRFLLLRAAIDRTDAGRQWTASPTGP